jgi:hypothetical protein
MNLTPRVAAGIEKVIPAKDRAQAAALLSSTNLGEDVCIAILRLARGDVARIPVLIDPAHYDYRDIISAAACPTRTYIVGVLRRGPNWTINTFLSGERLRAWKKADKIVIGGQFIDEDDPMGLYIFTVDSLEEAESLTAEDPGIQNGALAFEFHRWLSADALRVTSPPGWDI